MSIVGFLLAVIGGVVVLGSVGLGLIYWLDRRGLKNVK